MGLVGQSAGLGRLRRPRYRVDSDSAPVQPYLSPVLGRESQRVGHLRQRELTVACVQRLVVDLEGNEC